MKLFAQRHTYLGTEVAAPTLGIDAIASHDLQTPLRPATVVIPPQLLQASTSLSIASDEASINGVAPNGTGNGNGVVTKAVPPRAPSPPLNALKRKPPLNDRERDGSLPPAKRARPTSPPRSRPPPARRGRDWSPPRRERTPEDRDRGTVPSILAWFIGQLPGSASFDGKPLAATAACHSRQFPGTHLKTDEFISILKSANLPAAQSAAPPRARSPPPTTSCQW